MADDDDEKRRFEEAQREMGEPTEDDDKPPPRARASKRSSAASKPAGDASGDGNGQGPALRVVVPLSPGEPWESPTWQATTESVVDQFMRLHGENFYFVDDEGVFYYWTDKVWERDQSRRVAKLMGELCQRIGAKQKKPGRAKVESAGFINGAVGRVRDRLAGPFERLDQLPVLTTPGQTIVMNRVRGTGLTWREPLRSDMSTKITLVAPVKGPAPLWMAFLRRVMADDNDMVDYLQRVAGYCCSPFTTEQACFLCYGPGGSGKSTFLKVIKRLMGSYATTASLEMFLETRFEKHSEELAGLRARWLVIATELEKGRSWNEQKLKSLTSAEPIRARFMRQNSFEFIPILKIIVTANDAPNLKSVDTAMKRRLQIIPFNVIIPEADRDGGLEDRLIEQEGAQILWWILEGFEQWVMWGLQPPDKVIEASNEYFEEQDREAQFIEEEGETGPIIDDNYTVRIKDLFPRWAEFAQRCGFRAGTDRTLGRALKAKSLPPDGDGSLPIQYFRWDDGRGFRGLRLKYKPRGYDDRD